MATSFTDVFSAEEIDLILNINEVARARLRLIPNMKNTVNFNAHLPMSMKQKLRDNIGLNLSEMGALPMRWIQGDTIPHIDSCASPDIPFDKTHLMYLTDSEGTLDIDGRSYPIETGAAYVFSEGVHHGTSNTGLVPRLVLGPMNEFGAQVGITPTGISVGGGTTIYIRQNETDVEYSIDDLTWYSMVWPCSVENLSPSDGTVTLIFATDIVLTSTDYYFECHSDKIQFGSDTLRNDGTRPIITVHNAPDYNGFISNGNNVSDGKNYITIINLEIAATGTTTLAVDGGWFTQSHYGSSNNNNLIKNCFTGAPISEGGGGISGSYLASHHGFITIDGCSSSGIIGVNGGGIVGIQAGRHTETPEIGSITIQRCFSSGAIGNGGGGIVSKYASGNLNISDCYSTGSIGTGGGGIVGMFCGDDGSVVNDGIAELLKCYSTGAIGEDAGGIIGSSPGGKVFVDNCFSTGTISSSGYGGGIFGRSSNPTVDRTANNCYTSGLRASGTTGGIFGAISSDLVTYSANNYSEENNGGSGWNDLHAKSVLAYAPYTYGPFPVGLFSIQPDGLETPYKLFYGIYSPYSTSLVDYTVITVSQGESSPGGIAAGYTYSILFINGQISWPTISINSGTGVISTTHKTEPNSYLILVYNVNNLTGLYGCSIIEMNVLLGPTEILIQPFIYGKKFVGGNRDASSIAAKRTMITLNNFKRIDPIDPKKKSDTVNYKDVNSALTRVRGGGYIVPKKVTNRYLL